MLIRRQRQVGFYLAERAEETAEETAEERRGEASRHSRVDLEALRLADVESAER